MAQIRLDKMVAEAAGVPRAQARKLIQKGLVQVEGQVLKTADAKVEESAALTVQGKALSHKKYVYLMLNKPRGVVSASRDGRDTTVVDLVAADFPRRELFPAGRLDKESTGFVLLTDDGPFAHLILSPKRHVPKTYTVTVDTPVTDEMVRGFAEGVTLADGEKMLPAELHPDPADPCRARVVLHQGVYHQIKRMFGVFGAGVNTLHRDAVGQVALDGALLPGQWRELTDEEVALLRAAAENPSF